MNDIFIEGETINLCSPVDDDFNIWYKWFNSTKITKFLEQGKFPNSKNQQIKYYNDAIESGRFIVMIKSKKSKLIGVISLSQIDYEKSSCQIALVCPVNSRDAPCAALEAMALVTEHAFIRFGMSKVWASQAFPELARWTQKLEIIGYKVDGFGRGSFQHGINVSDSVMISIIKEDFLRLISRRSGSIWPGEYHTKNIYRNLRGHSMLVKKIYKTLKEINDEYELLLEKYESS